MGDQIVRPPVLTSASIRTPVIAKVSLILGLLSFFSCGLTSIPAVICDIVAVLQIRKSQGPDNALSQAMAGLIFGIVGFLIMAALLLMNLVQYNRAP
jgi:uncharacterized membrane protein